MTLCQEKEEIALRLLARCSALSITMFTLHGLYRMDYIDLDIIRWPLGLLLKLAKASGRFFLASGLWGKYNGPTWWSERWVSPIGDIRLEGKVRTR